MKLLDQLVEISPAVSGAWTDVDVADYGAPANTVGVEVLTLQRRTGSPAIVRAGPRPNGSTDDELGFDSFVDCTHFARCAVDGAGVFEVINDDPSTIDIYLVGFYTDDEYVGLTNLAEIPVSLFGAWHDIDYTSISGADSAVAAVIRPHPVLNRNCGLRPSGSTDEPINGIRRDNSAEQIVPLTGGLFEVMAEDTYVELFSRGYFISNVDTLTNGLRKVTSLQDTWEEWDLSASVAAEAIYAFGAYEAFDAVSARPKGSTLEYYHASDGQVFGWGAALGTSKTVEVRRRNGAGSFLLYGWVRATEDSTSFSILSVDLDNTIVPGQTSVVIVCEGAGDIQGTVDIDGVSQAIASWANTEIVLSVIDPGQLKMGVHTLRARKG